MRRKNSGSRILGSRIRKIMIILKFKVLDETGKENNVRFC
jgi:hypothetical protein